MRRAPRLFVFFFNDTATTEIYTLSLHDALPISLRKTKEPDISYILAAAGEIQKRLRRGQLDILESTTYPGTTDEVLLPMFEEDRKSTRLNSSHANISYAVSCLKKKKTIQHLTKP